MSEMDNAKGIFEKSSADQNDQHEFKIFQSYALKYKNIEALVNNGVVITSCEIAGKTYPIFIRLVNDFSPLVLGQDFFSQCGWSHTPGGNIQTQEGEILVDQENYGGRSIDVKLCEQVHQAEEIGKEKRKDQENSK